MSVSQKINPRQTVDTNACSQSGLTRLQKVLSASWTGGEESGVLFLSLSKPGWRHHRLTHWPARGRPSISLAASHSRQCHRVRKMVSRRLMCHPQWGCYKGVSLPIWQCLCKWRVFTNLTPCTEHGVTDVTGAQESGESLSHTHWISSNLFFYLK